MYKELSHFHRIRKKTFNEILANPAMRINVGNKIIFGALFSGIPRLMNFRGNLSVDFMWWLQSAK